MNRLRAAIYTRKSSEEGLDQEFNSLDAQREACEAYIASQKSEGWSLVKRAEHTANNTLRITTSIKVITRGGRTSQITPATGAIKAKPDKSLIAGLRRAHCELKALGIDLHDPSSSIETARGAGDPYIRKLIRLAFLAPDLQKMILQGRQPAGLKLADLIASDIPLDWQEQRALFAV